MTTKPTAPSTSRARHGLSTLLAVWLLSCAWAAASTWEPLPELGTARQEIAAVWLDDALYAIGGFDRGAGTLASVERWRPGEAAWETVAPLAVAVNHPAAAVVAGRLVVVGGYRGPGLGNATDAVQVYDPVADAWSLAAPMPSARGGLAAVALGDLLYVVGGANGGVSVADLAVYDPSADAWEALPPMPTPRDHLGVAVLDGRLHVLGGRIGGDHDHGHADAFILPTHEVYDPATGGWSAAPDMPTGRSGHAVAALDGCLYALGGEGNPGRRDGMFGEVERYHPLTGAWEAMAPMPMPRHGMGAVPLDGRLYVPGGGVVAGMGASTHADVLLPPTC